MKTNYVSFVSLCLSIAISMSATTRLTGAFLVSTGPTRSPRYSRIASTAENPSISSDADLLEQTPQSMFVELCEKFGLSTEGNKSELLARLRDYGKKQVDKERERLADRKRRIEEGGDDSREKFEFVGDDDDDDYDGEEDEDVYFYYPSFDKNTTNATNSAAQSEARNLWGVLANLSLKLINDVNVSK